MCERLLQWHLAVLAVIGTLFLGIAQGDFTLTVLSILAAVVAVVLVDTLRWFVLPRVLANGVAVVAVVYALRDYFNSESHLQLVAIANLLTYLQIVLLFQEKNPRLYWQLITLSLLQVVVSAALNLGVVFAALMLAYMAVMFSALGLFFLHRETGRFQHPEKRIGGAGAAKDALKDASSGGRGGRARADVASRPAPGGEATAAWRRIVGERPSTEFVAPARSLLGEMVRAGIARQIVIAMLMSVLFSGIMFSLSPRVRGTQWQVHRGRGMVGFSPKVSLKQMGAILQDATPAMRVAFHDAQGKPYMLMQEPYFAGAFLTRYGASDDRGVWSSSLGGNRPLGSLPRPPADGGHVRQTVWLEPTAELNLFSVFPPCRSEGTAGDVRFNRWAGQIERYTSSPSTPVGPFRYAVGTTGLRNGRQLELTPMHLRLHDDEEKRIYDRLRAELIQFDGRQLPNVARIAEKILRTADSLDADAIRKARILESHLQKSGLYRYSLDVTRRHDPHLDPVEDFLMNHRTGHCQFFASALALMLRSQGVPSRVVVGYHGGEYNSMGKYWLVRQRNAHAWVEAYLEPRELLEPIEGADQLTEAGAWLRLDPTPGLGGVDNEVDDAWRVGDMFGYAQFLWGEYVLGLNADRQRSAILEPLQSTTESAVSGLSDVQGWIAWLKRLRPDSMREGGLEAWFNWRAAVVAALLSAPLLLFRSLWTHLAGWASGVLFALRRLAPFLAPESPEAASHVEFYRRFESLLLRRGMRRERNQTQQEFADAVSARPEFAAQPEAAAAAERIAAQFYSIRFGNVPLDERTTESVETDLRTIDQLPSPGG